MRNERGATMPAVLIFTFLFLALFLHQVNLLLLEKRFYHETEQFFLLENIMTNAIREFQRDVQTSGIPTAYEYEEGTARLAQSFSSSGLLQVSIHCVTKEGRAYTASFLYNKNNKQITNWMEER
ncbi:competence type IV pilus minor pilin ComGG [Ectobacillus funiculus]|uniref:competence type IV pilus minor pilin ComGG n=1 Tax=Ectobacillus funiculus TaxID=137993 RepID=UPI00101B83EA|nr:competence type IV pilus minor pilin ComGG [Ectobacillus funiculus]